MINVYHEPYGLVFQKVEGDTGISYLSIPVKEVEDISGLLVRHGDPRSGRCGYYPVTLLFTDQSKRSEIAAKLDKRPPSETWVERTRNALETNGLKVLH